MVKSKNSQFSQLQVTPVALGTVSTHRREAGRADAQVRRDRVAVSMTRQRYTKSRPRAQQPVRKHRKPQRINHLHLHQPAPPQHHPRTTTN